MLRSFTFRGILACLFALSVGRTLAASDRDAQWFGSGDYLLRADLQLLNDARVIRLPISSWPIPRAAVAYALANARDDVSDPPVAAALERVRVRMQPKESVSFGVDLAVGNPGLLRDFDAIAREKGELGVRAEFESGRFAGSVGVRAAASPADGEKVRGDGSYLNTRLGNWLLSVHAVDRYWGPSHESSLILSNNARPMPTVMFERAEARQFKSRWLSWIGPWRMSFGVSRMEDSREDIDSPLFMAWRVTVMPFKDVELGFSRTAQFCGEGLECNLEVLGNLLAGNDNVGFDASVENEPGNQMAGFDLRWTSPVGSLPYAVYGQYIGEDESSYLPAKFLAQLGTEAWFSLASGARLQTFAEYSSTTCSANSGHGPYYNCAYTQGRFDVEGYRYRGRVIGHTTDADSETYSLGISVITPRGQSWNVTARDSSLNRDGVDPRNTVSPAPARYHGLELGWRGEWRGSRLQVDVGVDSLKPRGDESEVDAYGFVRWAHEFAP